MRLSTRRTGLVGLSIFLALVAAIAVFLYTSQQQVAEAVTFTPSTAAVFCNGLNSDFPSTIAANDADLLGPNLGGGCTEGAIPANSNLNLTTDITLPSGNSNFGSPVITNLGGTVAADAAIPDGQKVGGIRMDSTVGILNSPCNTVLILEYILYDSKTSGAPVSVAAEGTTNRFSSLATDGNSDTFADAASPAVTTNLDIYQNLFTPTGGSYIAPQARYTGLTNLASFEWQILSIFQVSAAGLDAFNNASDRPHIFARTSHAPTSGTISIMVEGDMTETQASLSPINDRCAPRQIRTMLRGMTPGGQVRYTTPSANTTLGISTYSYSLRDADNDGIENQLDTCPLASNIGADPDGDGIDNACDLTPAMDSNGGDHDSDLFSNRFDNCPNVFNGGASQVDSEIDEDYIDAAPDGGPKSDGIGDACDPDPLTSFNEGDFVEAYNLVPKCVGGTDMDGDGYCATQDLDDTMMSVAGFASNGGTDQEFEILNGNPRQGDGFGGNVERYIGTDPLKYCSATSTPNDEAIDANPMDFDDDGDFDPADYLPLRLLTLGGSVPSVVPARYDVTPNKVYSISDVLAISVRAAAALSNGNCLPASTPLASAGPIPSIDIDMNTSGNDATLSGGVNIQNCGTTMIAGTTTVDVIMPSPGVGTGDHIAAIDFDLAYDPDVVRVTAVSTSFLLGVAGGSSLMNFADALPDDDGLLRAGTIDFSTSAGVDETTGGVLARITLEGVGAGQSSLVITRADPYAPPAVAGVIDVTNVGNAAIAVGMACTPIPAGDADGDGIEDVSDSDPFTPSSDFLDEGGDKPTYGTIVSTGGAVFSITDSPDSDPDEQDRGVLVTVTSGGPVVIDHCGIGTPATIFAGSSVILTCGSAWIVTQAGMATLNMGTYTGTISAVAAAKFSVTVPGTYNVLNHALSQHAINIGGLSIAPNVQVNLIKDTDADGIVDQADFCPTTPTAWVVPMNDGDCDGFSDSAETSMGTMTNDPCGFTAGAPAQSETWPPDLVESNGINISDILALKPVFNTAVPPTSARLDLLPGMGVNISDILAIKPFFNKNCTP